jgi:hypothetical protein
MTEPCHTLEELAAVAELPPGDPRRAHLDACPRCRASLRSYREFMEPAELPAEARSQWARERLAATLEREVAGSGAEPGLEFAGAGAAPSWERTGLGTVVQRALARLRSGGSPALWPALAAVTVALLLVIVMPSGVLRRAPTAPALRGPEGQARNTWGGAARLLDSGATVFTWREIPGPERFAVLLYGPDLGEIARFDAARDTFLIVPPAGPLAGDGDRRMPPGARFYRIVGLRGGEEYARSGLLRLPRPE